MKKIISIFNGSPRKNGNSAYTTQQVVEIFKKKYSGNSSLYHISDYDIDPCFGCRQCMQLKHCYNQKDEFEKLFSVLKESDITIWVVPVYWFAPPGITKNFIDRTHGYFDRKGFLKGRS